MVATGAALLVGAPPASSASRAQLCPTFCGRHGGPGVIAFQQLRGDRVRVDLLANPGNSLELVVERSLGGHLASARPTMIDQHPQEVLTGRFPARERTAAVAQIRIRPLRRETGSRVVDLRGSGRSLAAGVYIVRTEAVTRAGRLRARGSSIVLRLGRGGRITYLLELHVAPGAVTAAASSVTPTDAILHGRVDPYGQATTYYFQYGTGTTYGMQTPSQPGGLAHRPKSVSASLDGLSFQMTYHYRLVATNCGGCSRGTSYGPERTFTTLPTTGLSSQQTNADRAIATYNAMQQYFYAANVYPGDRTSLYAQAYPASDASNRYSFLWPFSRALVGTITLANVPSPLLGGASYQAAVEDRLTGLSRYWGTSSSPPGYDSYPPKPYGNGGDKYYDDQAWIGLATAENYALTGNQSSLADAENVFNYVYPDGWAGGASFDPGGIFWVNQGVGVGVGNHNRTTNSTVPNAELALLLAAFNPANAAPYDAAADNMYGWANQYLYNVSGNPNFDSTKPALMFDHVSDPDTVDKTLWTYNQGATIAANVRLYQATGQANYLQEAVTIANTSLNTFTESQYLTNQPPAFNAIFFRGLLVLYSATNDTALQARIIQTIQTYADDAWTYYRSANGLFRFPSSAGTGYQVLDQGAMLQIYAALAWNPDEYGKLP